jgi:GNAT superfamily N-acetyltransferase
VMFEAMGFAEPVQLDAADAACTAYFAGAIPAGTFHGWLAVTRVGEAVASGGAVIDQHPPGPGNLSGRIGYVMNVVTDPRYRRRGIARRVMQMILEWLAAQGITRVDLHATEMGRRLYEWMGFVDNHGMRLKLE